MSTTTDILGAIKKIFLLSEDMARLTRDFQRLSEQVVDQDKRLVRLETIVAMSAQPRRVLLPGE